MRDFELSEKLLKWKRQIEDDKKEISQMEGGMSELLKVLKKDFGYISLEDAKAGVKKLEEKIKDKQSWIEKELLDIEKSYENLR